MNIDVIMTIVLLVMVVVIVAIVMYSMQDYISSVDEKVDGLKQGYVPLDKHSKDIDESRKEDAVLHDRINYTNEKINKSFDGNYDNLKNKPNLFDGDYTKLKNKPSDTGDYNKLINKPRLFDGEYGSLKNKPALFDGNYDNLENKPALFDGNYDNLTNVPTTFASNWSNIDDKPSKFPSSWDMIDGKPSNFANTWNNINEKPDHYPSKWDMIDDKPTFANAWDDIEGKPSTYDSTWDKVQGKPSTYDSTWDKVGGKPQKFPTSWDLITGKPADLTAPGGPAEYDDTELRGMINEKAAIAHTHTMYDIQGIDSNLSTMLTDYLSGYALSGHQHSYQSITGLSEYLDSNLNTKSAIGHRHEASDINNLQSVIDSNLPNLSGYATTSELTSGLGTKQNTLTAGTNVNISGNTISATQPDLSGYATTTALTTGLGTKQNTLTAGTNVNISGNTISATHPNLSGYATTTQLNRKQNKLTSSTDVSTGNLSVNGNITTTGTINGVSAAQFTELASGGGGFPIYIRKDGVAQAGNTSITFNIADIPRILLIDGNGVKDYVGKITYHVNGNAADIGYVDLEIHGGSMNEATEVNFVVNSLGTQYTKYILTGQSSGTIPFSRREIGSWRPSYWSNPNGGRFVYLTVTSTTITIENNWVAGNPSAAQSTVLQYYIETTATTQ
jgi:hypothetical protein